MSTRTPLATMVEVSDYLKTPVWTLRRWRSQGTGPKSSRVGRNVRYKWADVDTWLESQTKTPAR